MIHAIEAQIVATREFMSFTKAQESADWNKFKKLLEITDRQVEKIYELGFIAFFANFECFMFELLKELFIKYPAHFQSEKLIKFEDINKLSSVDDIKHYFIDTIAIEKSYDIETWNTFLSTKIGIKIFKSQKESNNLKALNSLRNLFLHSGAKTNSKFRREMKLLIKSYVPIGELVRLDRRKLFGGLYGLLRNVIENAEKQKVRGGAKS